MAKIYDFPQGKKINQLKKESKKLKRKNKLSIEKYNVLFNSVFFYIRFFIASFLDFSLTASVMICRSFVYLIIPLGVLFLLISYNTNNSSWSFAMYGVLFMIFLGVLDPEDVSKWHLFKRLLGVYITKKVSE